MQHLSLWRLPTFKSGLFIISFPQKVSEADLFSVAHPLIILRELSRNGHSITVGGLNEPLGWGWIQWIQGGVWKLPSWGAKHSSTPTEAGWELSHRTRDIICAWFMCVFGLVSVGSGGHAVVIVQPTLRNASLLVTRSADRFPQLSPVCSAAGVKGQAGEQGWVAYSERPEPETCSCDETRNVSVFNSNKETMWK